MKKFKEYISEDITKSDLNQIEKYADKLFAAVGIDVEIGIFKEEESPV